MKRAALVLLLALPWLVYFALVGSAWWLIMFDGRAATNELGWVLLALALPALFAASKVSAWERRWIKTRFQAESWLHQPSGGGRILDRLLDWP